MHHLTCRISSLLHSVNLILFTLLLVHLIWHTSPVGGLISLHSVAYHKFSDDIQLVIALNTSDSSPALLRLSDSSSHLVPAAERQQVWAHDSGYHACLPSCVRLLLSPWSTSTLPVSSQLKSLGVFYCKLTTLSLTVHFKLRLSYHHNGTNVNKTHRVFIPV